MLFYHTGSIFRPLIIKVSRKAFTFLTKRLVLVSNGNKYCYVYSRGGGGGGYSLIYLYRYVPSNRIGCLRCSVLK